jgi:hypothetical protein
MTPAASPVPDRKTRSELIVEGKRRLQARLVPLCLREVVMKDDGNCQWCAVPPYMNLGVCAVGGGGVRFRCRYMFSCSNRQLRSLRMTAERLLRFCFFPIPGAA